MTERVVVELEQYSESRYRWYAVTILPDSNGGIVVRFSDVADRKFIENALRKSEEKFSKAFRSSPAAMCIVDVDRNGTFLEVNETFERITGFQRDEIIGRTSTELGLYADLQDLPEHRKRLLAEGGYRNLEVRFRKKNGEVIVGLISAEQIEIDGSLCAIATSVDITESVRAHQALQESEELSTGFSSSSPMPLCWWIGYPAIFSLPMPPLPPSTATAGRNCSPSTESTCRRNRKRPFRRPWRCRL